MPVQPVAFSHSIHADQLGVDCRYCHNAVEKSWYSNIPASSVCMNCHSQVLKDDPKLALVRESYQTGKPIPWVQIHKLPDFVYFNHSVHVNRGVSCVECHGQITKMDEVHQAKPLNMSVCLECHRNPAAHLRSLDKITDLDWKPTSADQQRADGAKFVHDWRVESLQNCSACHPDENHSRPPCPVPDTGPKYWRSLDQLADSPEFREWVEREFPSGAE